MKSYDETINTVFDRIGEYEKTKKKRKKVVTKTAVSFCCVCAIALVGIGLLKGNPTPDDYADDALYPGIKDTIDDVGKGETPGKDIIIFNAITEKVQEMAGIALFRDDEVPMTKAELSEYFGVNVFPDCPDGFKETQHWLGIYKRNKGTGEVYFDANKLQYTNADASKTIVVNVNTIFYLIESSEGISNAFAELYFGDAKESIINGVDVMMAEIKSENYYYAEFMYKDVSFSVYSENATQDEFISVISSLVTE